MGGSSAEAELLTDVHADNRELYVCTMNYFTLFCLIRWGGQITESFAEFWRKRYCRLACVCVEELLCRLVTAHSDASCGGG